jgi:addiction module HigA family antidote
MAVKLLEPIHPGEILHEEFMRPMAVSINALAREIAVPPNRVSDIVNGKRSITADTALRPGQVFRRVARAVAQPPGGLRPARRQAHDQAEGGAARAGPCGVRVATRHEESILFKNLQD